eukprot:scaffold1852_cov15-Prasinocladus_malaysianus.AAC.1
MHIPRRPDLDAGAAPGKNRQVRHVIAHIYPPAGYLAGMDVGKEYIETGGIIVALTKMKEAVSANIQPM